MKKKRNLMIAVGVLVLLCAAYGAVRLTGGTDPALEEQDSIAVNTKTDVVSLRMEPAGAQAYTLLVKEEEGGGRSLWISGCDQRLAMDVNAAGTLLSSLERLKAYEQVEGDPGQFGITDKSSRAVLEFSDGTALNLVFGGGTPVAGRAYVLAEEQDRIYVIRKDIADRCARPVYALRKAQLFADCFGTGGDLAVNAVEIRGGDTLLIRPQSAEETENSFSDAPSYYRMDRPVSRECSDGKVDADVLTPLLALDGRAEVAEDHPGDTAQYGLAEGQNFRTVRINAGDVDCQARFSQAAGDGYVYAMRMDLPSVLRIPADAEELAALDLQWYDLVNTSLWMRSLDKVKTVQVETPAGSFQLTPVRSESGEIRSGTLSGEPIDEERLRELYMKVLNIHIDGRLFLKGDTSEKGNGPEAVRWKGPDADVGSLTPDYSVTVGTLAGTEETFTFYAVDARTYAIARDARLTGFYTGIAALSDLEKDLTAGGDPQGDSR